MATENWKTPRTKLSHLSNKPLSTIRKLQGSQILVFVSFDAHLLGQRESFVPNGISGFNIKGAMLIAVLARFLFKISMADTDSSSMQYSQKSIPLGLI